MVAEAREERRLGEELMLDGQEALPVAQQPGRGRRDARPRGRPARGHRRHHGAEPARLERGGAGPEAGHPDDLRALIGGAVSGGVRRPD